MLEPWDLITVALRVSGDPTCPPLIDEIATCGALISDTTTEMLLTVLEFGYVVGLTVAVTV
jgi:hypothetical protein